MAIRALRRPKVSVGRGRNQVVHSILTITTTQELLYNTNQRRLVYIQNY